MHFSGQNKYVLDSKFVWGPCQVINNVKYCLTESQVGYDHLGFPRTVAMCLSCVKVMFWHVSECVNLQVSVSGYKLVTCHVAR